MMSVLLSLLLTLGGLTRSHARGAGEHPLKVDAPADRDVRRISLCERRRSRPGSPHSTNHFRRSSEYVSLYFSIGGTLTLAAIVPLRRRYPAVWRDVGHLVGWSGIGVGLVLSAG